MKAVSSIIAVILILMVGASLASFTYIFFTGVMSETTEAGSETAERVSTSLLAEMKIESIDSASEIVDVSNTGKVNLTSFNVFVNGVLDSAAVANPSTLMPGAVSQIVLGIDLNSGDIVKVTTAQGATALKSVPSIGITYVQWGITTSGFTSFSTHTSVRCMGGQAPSSSNMKIESLHIRFSDSATGAMAIYFGGTESSPSGAIKQAEVINQAVSAGWNTFTLASELDWPASQVTWICWKRSGTGGVYYSDSSTDAGDFYSSHGRHDAGSGSGGPDQPFSNTLGAASFTNYWYSAYLTYYQA
jgi:hypothetical protein